MDRCHSIGVAAAKRLHAETKKRNKKVLFSDDDTKNPAQVALLESEVARWAGLRTN